MDRAADAIEQLYRERYVRFRNAVATVTGSFESARDAVQEGFTLAFRSRQQFRGEGSLEGWVWRIVLRAAIQARSLDAAELPLDEIQPEFVEPDRDSALTEAIRTLPPRRRLAVFLRYFADLDYRKIAEILEIDEGTVAATLAQARQAIAHALSEEEVPS